MKMTSERKAAHKAAYRKWYDSHREEILARAKVYRDTHREEIRARHNANARRRSLKRLYGLTLEDYDRLLAEQGGVCGICHGPPNAPGKKAFAVDHDHATGRVRGLLCTTCNVRLGVYESEFTERARRYLEHI